MKLHLPKFKHPFSVKLTVYTTFVVALVFIVALTDFYRSSCDHVKADAMCNAQTVLSKTKQEIESVLQRTALIPENVHWQLTNLVEYPDSLYGITQRVLHSNPLLCGCAIALKPGYLKEYPLFAPYSYRVNNEIHTKQLNSAAYNYAEKSWFKETMSARKAVWTEPYFDKMGGEQHMITYSKPLFDENGEAYGVFTADLSITQLGDFVHEMDPYSTSFSFILNRKADYVVCPNVMDLKKTNLFSSADYNQRDDLRELAVQMAKGESGYMELGWADYDYFIFYAPIQSTNWSIGVGSLENEIFESIHLLTHKFILEAVLGLLLLIILCYTVIRHMLKPLEQLTASAIEIADGNFSAHLPHPVGNDEMSVLCQSFDFMQRSLSRYMEELKQTTKARERIASELRIAGTIQKKMVPATFPIYPTNSLIDVYADLEPAKAVGGDFYQFIQKGDCFFFIIGDVSGKGVPAALVMSALCRMFRMIVHDSRTPGEIMKAMNDALVEDNDTNMFCTAFVGALHLSTGKLEYCNAGHNAPIWMPLAEAPRWMSVKSNLPLGLFGKILFEQQEILINPGDSLLLYTDGVTESEDRENRFFTDEGLMHIAPELSRLTSEDAVKRLFGAVHHHAAGTEPSDDVTVLCLTYDPKNKAAYGEKTDHSE